jgi:hypothetical protein
LGCIPADPAELAGWIEAVDLNQKLPDSHFETRTFFERAVDEPLHATQYIYDAYYPSKRSRGRAQTDARPPKPILRF